MIDVLVPVLDRPLRALAVAESVWRAATVPYQLVFLVSPGDPGERDACANAAAKVPGVTWVEMPFARGPGDYARKINLGVELTSSPWVFTGADDLDFRQGWDSIAIGAGDGARASVVGTNDLGNPQVRRGQHSTHSLVRRSYVSEVGATFDRQPGILLHEGYDHQWCDTELVAAAKALGLYVHAHDAVVEHLHWAWHKSANDSTYAKANAQAKVDGVLFKRRLRHRQRV